MERDIPQAINPDRAIGTGDINNPRFPERVGRTRFDTALELIESREENGQSTRDWSLFNSALEMDAVTDRGDNNT